MTPRDILTSLYNVIIYGNEEGMAKLQRDYEDAHEFKHRGSLCVNTAKPEPLDPGPQNLNCRSTAQAYNKISCSSLSQIGGRTFDSNRLVT